MTTPAYQIRLTDLRQLVGGLVDLRARAALQDLRQLVGGLVEVGVPEVGVGGVLTVPARVPALTTTGAVALLDASASPWKVAGGTVLSGLVSLAGQAVRQAEPQRYTPGPSWPAGGQVGDVLRVTDALGATATVEVVTSEPSGVEVTVPVDADSVASVAPGGHVIMAGSGGTGPYTFAVLQSETGGDVVGIASNWAWTTYRAGPAFGVDRIRVTDSLGAVGYITVEVKPNVLQVAVDGSGIDSVWGALLKPYAFVDGAGGQAPYTVTLEADVTGAAISPAKVLRAFAGLTLAADGTPVDTTGWTGTARLYSQRGAVLADGLVVTATGEGLEVALPDPSTVVYPVAVLRIVAHPASGVLAVMAPDLTVELLLRAEEA